jgi:membrane protein YqaA with SNARE-associated domain
VPRSLSDSPPVPRPAGRPQRLWRAVGSVYSVLHRWGESGWAKSAVGGWGFLQGSVVPGPSDIVLIPLGLADPRRAFALAAAATIGSTLGGLVAYLIGAELFDTVGRWVLDRFGVSNETWAGHHARFETRGWMIVVLSTMSPISTKFVCLAAGAFGIPLGEFTLALFAGRGTRFMAIAVLLRFAGERLRAYLLRKVGRAGDGPEV